ncbi:EscR/YscR/HrcR family type III secretion system export apparatus protein, partial [Escherichia coli]
MSNSISLIAILTLFTLLPFIIASGTYFIKFSGSDSNLLIVFYVQIMPDDLVM